jgi:translation elongation factor EF-Tu-like GTPase
MTSARILATARVALRSTAAGGREGPINTGYRALVVIDGFNSDAILTLTNGREGLPGGEAEIELSFLFPEYFGARLRVGATFEMREGARVIGTGTIERLWKE